MAQTYDCPCNTCGYALWDYEEYYGGAKRWFYDGCGKDLEPEEGECEGYEEYEERQGTNH
jgi:hypothetical protein